VQFNQVTSCADHLSALTSPKNQNIKSAFLKLIRMISFCSLDNLYIWSAFEHGGAYQNTLVAYDALTK